MDENTMTTNELRHAFQEFKTRIAKGEARLTVADTMSMFQAQALMNISTTLEVIADALRSK